MPLVVLQTRATAPPIMLHYVTAATLNNTPPATFCGNSTKCCVLQAVLLTYAKTVGSAAGPWRFDRIVFNSPLLGKANMSDSAWHDDTWAFRRYGPISRLTLYKAWFYDGVWHNPGEFKGIQTW